MKLIKIKISDQSQKFMDELTRICDGQVSMEDLWEKAFEMGLEQVAQSVIEATGNETSSQFGFK
jgi:lysylphosphatidylglycerol synthetase-like protein (DUF2156 family)